MGKSKEIEKGEREVHWTVKLKQENICLKKDLKSKDCMLKLINSEMILIEKVPICIKQIDCYLSI